MDRKTAHGDSQRPVTFDMFDVLAATEAEPRRLENRVAGCMDQPLSIWRDSVVNWEAGRKP